MELGLPRTMPVVWLDLPSAPELLGLSKLFEEVEAAAQWSEEEQPVEQKAQLVVQLH